MPIYTFSTKPNSDQEVAKLKLHCKKRYLNFSAMVIKAIEEQNKAIENANNKR